jgi:peptidoglycan L-alanyl-D-glutamate endopeptidase CwlK
MSRDIKDCVPELQALYASFCEEMDKEGLRFILSATKRTATQQLDLYAQGRTKPGPIVTWTKDSNHMSGRAFDIAMIGENGKADWREESYDRPGEIGKSIGLEWGGDWLGKKKDKPHFQLKGDA